LSPKPINTTIWKPVPQVTEKDNNLEIKSQADILSKLFQNRMH